jgi:hypothetical protein
MAVFTFKLCFCIVLLRECVIRKMKLIIFTGSIKSVNVKQRIKQSDFEKEVTSFHVLIHFKTCSIWYKLSLKNIKYSCRSIHLVSHRPLNSEPYFCLRTKCLLAEPWKKAIISLVIPKQFLILGIFADLDNIKFNAWLRQRALVAYFV